MFKTPKGKVKSPKTSPKGESKGKPTKPKPTRMAGSPGGSNVGS